MSATLDNQLDVVEDFLDKTDLDSARKTLDLIKVLVKRNDNAALTLRYSKLYRRYEDELIKEITGVDKPDTKHTQTDVTLQHSLDRLVEARLHLEESEQVGASTLVELKSQREELKKIKSNIAETNDKLVASNKLLTGMSRWWRR